MARKPRLSPAEERKAKHEIYKADLRRRHAETCHREEAELALAKAVVRAHRILGEAIKAAAKAGIEDPQALVAEYVADIAKARECDRIREQEEAENEGI